MPKLLLASNNPGKVSEYRSMLGGLGFQVVTLAEQGVTLVVDEQGDTFEQNAQLKALTYARLSRLITLADDSGLEVDALGGEPGIYSARFAGEGATDADRVKLLLAKLNGVPWEKRTAHFRCVIAIVTPKGQLELCQGECHGIIALEPEGKSGFGYDPVFYLPELRKTMAEVPMEIKNQISHRGQAIQKARQVLQRLCHPKLAIKNFAKNPVILP